MPRSWAGASTPAVTSVRGRRRWIGRSRSPTPDRTGHRVRARRRAADRRGLTVARGELDRAEELLDRALRIVERFDDLRRGAFDSAFRGQVARARGDHAGAVAHHDRARALYARLGSAPGVAWSHYDLGLLDRRRGDVAGAIEHLEESLAQFRDTGYTWAVGCVAWALATVELRRGRVERRRRCWPRRWTRSRRPAMAAASPRPSKPPLGLPASRARTGQGGLLGAAAVLRERLAAPLPDERPRRSPCVVAAGAPSAWARGGRAGAGSGRRLPNAQVGAIARRVLRASQLTPRAAGGPPHRLGTHQPADRPGAGHREKTTEVHVHHIIGKLGARCRSEVAAWVGAQGTGRSGPDSTHG